MITQRLGSSMKYFPLKSYLCVPYSPKLCFCGKLLIYIIKIFLNSPLSFYFILFLMIFPPIKKHSLDKYWNQNSRISFDLMRCLMFLHPYIWIQRRNKLYYSVLKIVSDSSQFISDSNYSLGELYKFWQDLQLRRPYSLI